VKINLKTIKSKLMITLMSLCLIPLLLLGVLSVNKTFSIVEQRFKVSAGQSANEINKGLDKYFEGMSSLVDVVSTSKNFTTYLESGSENKLWAEDLLKGVKDSNAQIMNVYMGTVNKDMVIYPKQDLPADYNPTTRPWYSIALASKGKIAYSNPYKDATSGKLITSISKTVENNGQVVGVVAIDIDLTTLSQELSTSKIGKTGYAFITTAEGTMLAHPETKNIGTDIATTLSFWNEFKTNKNGFVEYKYEGKDKYLVYATNAKTGWKIGIIMESSELIADTNASKNFVIIFLIIFALLSAFISLMFSNYISKIINKLKASFTKASEGDLTSRVHVKTKDEFKELGDSFNLMLDNISVLISDVKTASKTVADTSGNLASMTEEVSASIDQVSCAVEEIAKGTSEQASSAQESALAIGKLSNIIDKVSEITIEANDLSKTTSNLGNKGLDLVKVLVAKTERTTVSSLEVGKVVSEMNESTKVISSITATIENIASQTNLLALNAAIEAARAGEHGRGFSVVADEIRKLAEQSSKSTKDITKIISELTEKTKVAVQSMDNAKIIVEEQNIAVEQTKDIFAEIISAINTLTLKLEEVKSSTNEMENSKANIVQEIENISAVSEETSASTEEVSASAEEISATMNDFSGYAVQLQQLAEALSEDINKFKLS